MAKQNTVKQTQLTDYTPDPANANQGTARGLSLLDKSLSDFGVGRSLVVDKNGVIIAGNKTGERAVDLGLTDAIEVETDGSQVVVVKRIDLDLLNDDENHRARGLAYSDNRVGEVDLAWDGARLLADMQAGIEPIADMFDPSEIEALVAASVKSGDAGGNGDGSGVMHKTLAERFLVPPFSVLDARQGYWQLRKANWIALGIQSELGRGEGIVPNGTQRTPDQDGASMRRPSKKVRSINDHEWQAAQDERPQSRLTWVPGDRTDLDETSVKNLDAGRRGRAEDFGTEGNVSEQSGTSIFDPVLCELAYRWFCPPHGAILDPFAGGSVRGIVSNYLGYSYTGIDLSAPQIDANEKQAARIVPGNLPRWHVGDSRSVRDIAPGEYDLVFSCPPYYDLEVYSDDPLDLSNGATFDDFIVAYRQIIGDCVAMLKPNRFACFVVGDIRDSKGFYRNFPALTISAFQDAGMMLYNEAILVTAVGSLPLRVGRQFAGYRKLGKTHQNVLIFYKGEPSAIKEFGPVQTADMGDDDSEVDNA